MINDYSLVSLQVNLFPNKKLLTNTTEIASQLLALQHFTGDATILPISGTNIPDSVAAITLKTPNKLEICEVSNDKISLTWLLNPDSDANHAFNEMPGLIRKVSVATMGKVPEFNRVGIVSTISQSIKNTEQDSSILQNILTQGASRLRIPHDNALFQFFLNSTYEHSLGIHQKCFRVFTIGTAKQEHPRIDNVFAIQQDINTQPDATNKFDLVFIENFITQAKPLLTKDETHNFVWGN